MITAVNTKFEKRVWDAIIVVAYMREDALFAERALPPLAQPLFDLNHPEGVKYLLSELLGSEPTRLMTSEVYAHVPSDWEAHHAMLRLAEIQASSEMRHALRFYAEALI